MNRETLVKKAKVIISVSNVQHVRRGYTVYCYEQVGDPPKFYLVWDDHTLAIPMRLAPTGVSLYRKLASRIPGAVVDGVKIR